MRPCADVATIRDGLDVDVAGEILVRQKPGSAKGELLIAIEDETGVDQGILFAHSEHHSMRAYIEARPRHGSDRQMVLPEINVIRLAGDVVVPVFDQLTTLLAAEERGDLIERLCQRAQLF